MAYIVMAYIVMAENGLLLLDVSALAAPKNRPPYAQVPPLTMCPCTDNNPGQGSSVLVTMLEYISYYGRNRAY